MSISEVGMQMLNQGHNNLHKMFLAAGAAGLFVRAISKLGLTSTTTMCLTAAASSIFYATQPFFESCEDKE